MEPISHKLGLWAQHQFPLPFELEPISHYLNFMGFLLLLLYGEATSNQGHEQSLASYITCLHLGYVWLHLELNAKGIHG